LPLNEDEKIYVKDRHTVYMTGRFVREYNLSCGQLSAISSMIIGFHKRGQVLLIILGQQHCTHWRSQGGCPPHPNVTAKKNYVIYI
jgi:hypothetical protein